MSAAARLLPGIHPAASATTFSEWRVADPKLQHAAMDAAIVAWDAFPWPAGLLSHTCLAAEDGYGLRHFAQWVDPDAYLSTASGNVARFSAIEGAAGTRIDRVGHAVYGRPRSFCADADPTAVGCAVIVDVVLEEPAETAQQDWIDAVDRALAEAPPNGLVAAHLYRSADGARVVSYALWTSARAHRESLSAAMDEPTKGASPWRAVRDHPGIADVMVTRFRHHRTATREREVP